MAANTTVRKKKKDAAVKTEALAEIEKMILQRVPDAEIRKRIGKKYGYTDNTINQYKSQVRRRWSRYPLNSEAERRECIRHYKMLQYNLMMRLASIPVGTKDTVRQNLAIKIIRESKSIQDKMTHVLGIRELKVDGPIIQQTYVDSRQNTQVIEVRVEDLEALDAHELAQLYHQYDQPQLEEDGDG